jgi:hypothetical protein
MSQRNANASGFRRRTPDARRQTHNPALRTSNAALRTSSPRLFWLFWGAKKRGLFWGPPKKSIPQQVLRAGPTLFAWKHKFPKLRVEIGLRRPDDAEVGAPVACKAQGESFDRMRMGLFWGRPQKSRSAPMADLFRPSPLAGEGPGVRGSLGPREWQAGSLPYDGCRSFATALNSAAVCRFVASKKLCLNDTQIAGRVRLVDKRTSGTKTKHTRRSPALARADRLVKTVRCRPSGRKADCLGSDCRRPKQCVPRHAA